MKYNKIIKGLEARQKDYEGTTAVVKETFKKPGSMNRKRSSGGFAKRK